MTRAQQVAVEVSERYRCYVPAACVKFIAPNVSGLPMPWEEQISWKEQREIAWKNLQRARRLENPKAAANPFSINDGESETEALLRMVGAGATYRQIGAALGISAPAAMKRALRLGLRSAQSRRAA